MNKKICSFIIMIFLCAGCSSIGSFEQGTLKLDDVYKNIINEIEKNNMIMGSMLDISIDEESLFEQYGLQNSDIQDFIVHQSMIPAQCAEIAIFHLVDNNEQVVLNGIEKRISQMKQSAILLSNQIAIIEAYQVVKKGEYMIFICGVDAIKVIQYINSR